MYGHHSNIARLYGSCIPQNVPSTAQAQCSPINQAWIKAKPRTRNHVQLRMQSWQQNVKKNGFYGIEKKILFCKCTDLMLVHWIDKEQIRRIERRELTL